MKITKILIVLALFLISTTKTFAIETQEVQKLRETVQQKVKEKLQQITSPAETITNGPKSFFGTITKIETTQITIDYKNSSKVLSIGESTSFIDAKRNKTQLDKIKIGQDVLALGYLNSDDSLDTKRLIITDLKTIENNNQVVIGKIVDISKTSPIFVLIPSKDKNNQFQIKNDSKTTKLASGDKVIVIIKPDLKMAKTFSASKIISLSSPASASASPTPRL
ncbi:MAG: hypothetical protein WCG91_04275 [Candidatus Shapirobacteria bacterium]